MSEESDRPLRDEQKLPPPPQSLSSFFLKILSDSISILRSRRHLFLPIFLFLNLPLAILLFSLSLSSRPLKREILHLESVALQSPTFFEARQIWKESREDSLTLLRLKLFYSLPAAVLSLISSVFVIHAASAGRPTVQSAVAAFRLSWLRVIVTSLCSYAFFLSFVHVPLLLAAGFKRNPPLSLLISFVGSGFEIYLMAVLGMALVASVLDERYGWEAIRVGWGLMQGRRACGWAISGLMVALSGLIGSEFGSLTEGDEYSKRSATWVMVVTPWERLLLACLYSALVLWSYVITTVFYSDCQKRHLGHSFRTTVNDDLSLQDV